ncbi:hypothetical protein [Undibacterium sp. TS12]|uniref:hypothetical protein n=1 Tax=Undibacterium sp. TS12 TaxID=2908202 RepID=UPI001F4CAB39|nr:hypothetical protein [Undibacterium sp. TS12]MCH8621455.1 hypothetical protein [Undibacterium sp. TS12]
MEQIHPMPNTTESVLRFSLPEGLVANEFLREGPVAVHLLLTSGTEARLLAAFPAGNSATGLWFEPDGAALFWHGATQLQAAQSKDDQGRLLVGVTVDIGVDRARLIVSGAVLSSARVLRDYQHDRRLPPGMHNTMHMGTNSVRWSRDRIDGSAGYAMVLQVLNGSVSTDAHGQITLSTAGQMLQLRLTALTGEPALQPLPADQLLREPTAGTLRARQSLAFLSYRDKLLAGSWRFNTYFGRDTLMSLMLLMPALTRQATEAGLASVLERLDPKGAVAHEEDIGEMALLHGSGGVPVYDYKMVDDDFMLAPVARAYLLEHAGSAQHAAEWLAQKTADGESYGTALCRNFQLVQRLASDYAQRPGVDTLIHLRNGQVTGDWRDSADGLGGGVVSYNVNAILVPAALHAIAALHASGLLAPYLPDDATAAGLAQLWEEQVPAYFAVQRDTTSTQLSVRRCAQELGIDAAPALASLDEQGLAFSAIALDAQHQPIPVLHSDFGFALLLLQPPTDVIERELAAMMRPYPAGLMTGVGLVVANGAYASDALRPLFGPDRYHGAVVWSWQQALLAAGLARQLLRVDLPVSTRDLLVAAQQALWPVIQSTQAQSNSELWSWTWGDGQYRLQPFGPGAATTDEANAVQLWSTVYLAVRPPLAASTMT